MENRVERLNSEDKCETDRVTAIELQKHRRVLYFSDGTMEIDTDNEDLDPLDVVDRKTNVVLEGSFLSRFRNTFSRLGSSILSGIDYIGEELADFFGITAKTNANSIDYHKTNTSIVNPEEGANINNNNNERNRAFSCAT